MEEETSAYRRFFVTYTGVKLPAKPVNPIGEEALLNRNTFIRAYYNSAGALTGFDKVVYGEVELAHRYEYYDSGTLKRAEIAMAEEDTAVMNFDEAGVKLLLD